MTPNETPPASSNGALYTITERGEPARTVAVCADGRFEVVSRDGWGYGRANLWLRSRAGLFSREARDAIGCFAEPDDGGYDEPVTRVEFTGPRQVTISLRDGRSGTADFDGPTLIVTGRQGGCAGPGPAPGGDGIVTCEGSPRVHTVHPRVIEAGLPLRDRPVGSSS